MIMVVIWLSMSVILWWSPVPRTLGRGVWDAFRAALWPTLFLVWALWIMSTAVLTVFGSQQVYRNWSEYWDRVCPPVTELELCGW